ncbi:MAG: hypothetical protein CMC04_05995 [Flavobacteriaceae bacterium]|nr:hypothetical protein [Flavobacteriaceae bacterium]|tara:strand:+ start:17138 stop:18436 length:1299 start_codon:yes stop_codon:yes gene_type:complete
MNANNFTFKMKNIFNKREQYLLNIFAFLIAWPPVKIGVNLSFYVFLFLLGSMLKRNINPIKSITNYQKLFWSFLILGILTTIIKKPFNLIQDQFISDFLILFNYLYWIVVAIFIVSNRNRINLLLFSKYYFFGSIFLILFYFIPGLPEFSNPIIQFPVIKGRNVLVYQLINIIPIAIIYILHKKSKATTILVILLYLIIMLLSNGRAGSIILLILTFLLFLIVYPKHSRFYKNCFFFLLISFVIVYNDDNNKYLDSLAKPIENISPRIAELIRKEGNGVASNDKSWLIREVMVKKGMMIANEHPIFGIGFNRFRNYNVELSMFLANNRKYDRLGYKLSSSESLNNRSPHNSYIQILAENGFVGLLIFILALFFPLRIFFKRLLKNQLSIIDAPLISLVGLTIYLYVISSYPTTITFVTISLAYNSSKMRIVR